MIGLAGRMADAGLVVGGEDAFRPTNDNISHIVCAGTMKPTNDRSS